MEQNLLNSNKITFNNEENPNTLPLSEEEFNKIQNKKWDEKCDYINNLIEFISTHNSIEIDYNLLSLYIKYFLSFPNLKVNSTCLDFLISLTPILNTNENYSISYVFVPPQNFSFSLCNEGGGHKSVTYGI